MNIRRPVSHVAQGQALTARRWNGLADAVNGAVRAPQSIDGGLRLPSAGIPEQGEPEPDDVILGTGFDAVRQVTVTERVFDPDDESVFVDVERVTKLLMVDRATGRLQIWNLDPDA